MEGEHSVIIELEEADMPNKKYELRVQGEVFDVQLADEVDQLVQAMGLSTEAHRKVGDIKAPMPGLVLNIEVQPGDVVEKGQALLILEAMKMENVLKSPGDGTVLEIKVKKGDAVDKGQLLIQME
ncbi:MAG: acetyl-CoA carboxylase biotin carboxyl carrier protein subunit [Phaeodactylibacter sp.]|nr:acetyl-CoA carboxylase biotin carboxyl carrier protein subunit [Phaeodactylibacter sp.]